VCGVGLCYVVCECVRAWIVSLCVFMSGVCVSLSVLAFVVVCLFGIFLCVCVCVCVY